ncbi:MAG: acyl-ACP--UDP-N-acetylglucosamine O-acyltransferase [Calditrichaeota bacterium]|nr:MAG: acyl-ACP--UDP-N-acetylglucosamine O-acyltransferase [Calditrichota bacterium]
MAQIHPTAIVHKNAEIHEDAEIGPYTIIEDDVRIDAGTTVGPHVLIASGTRIGKNCQIHKGASLGSIPQDLKFYNEKTYLEIGDNTTIREFATLNRGTAHSVYTRIGKNCLLMAYTHVAHDCQLGNNVILSNSVNLAGHVIIEDFVGIGGLTPVHQFTRIGAHSFIGGGLRIHKDIPPYILAMGEPLKFAGLNLVGLKRRNFTSEQLTTLKKVYNLVYRQSLTTQEAIRAIRDTFDAHPEALHVAEFLEKSERGIVR